MMIEEATPGTRIIERHVTAHPRTVMAWSNDAFGEIVIVVANDQGRTSRIKAKNIGRYDKIEREET